MTRLSSDFRQQCEAIASQWRARIGLQAFDPLPARRLAKEMEATLRNMTQLPGLSQEMIALLPSVEISGFISSHEPLIIYYNPFHSATRFESTIMHELAHIILEHPPEKVTIISNELIREVDKHKEAEADFLGSCMQIPRRGIVWARQRNLSKATIASHFGASEQVVQWRLNIVK